MGSQFILFKNLVQKALISSIGCSVFIHGMILEKIDKKFPFFGPLGKKGNRNI
jgi:hypothetical protein